LNLVRLMLDDAEMACKVRAGATGTPAIRTVHVKAAPINRRVMPRMTAILSYVNPF
jgi:hypothetical protein